MELYIVRHAEAEPAAPGAADSGRRLTRHGVGQARAVANGLRALGVTLDRLWTSPLRRAMETATVLSSGLGGPAPEPCDVLDGRAPAEAILDELAVVEDGERVAVVGHMPGLGELVVLAVAPAGPGVALATASVARVDFTGAPRTGAGRLVWIRTVETFHAG
jgi:phosphohistidine phosphatase